MALIPAVYQSTTDQAFFCLLTIHAAGTLPTMRVVNNLEEVVSRGETFEPYPFSIVLAADDAETQPSVKITIDAVDQRIIKLVREMIEPPAVLLEVVLSGTPDVVDKSIDYLRLVNVQYDALSVTGTLQPVNFLNAPAVDSLYTGIEFPDLVWI